MSTTLKEQLKNACEKGEEAKMRAILQEDPSLINCELGNYKITPLMVACYSKRLPLVKALLSYEGILINKQDKTGYTPLYHACSNGYDKIVEELLKRAEIEVNLSDEDGYSPLHAACHWGNTAVVRLLLSDGRVDRNLKNKKGKTAFDVICDSEYADESQAPVIKKLFEDIPPPSAPPSKSSPSPAINPSPTSSLPSASEKGAKETKSSNNPSVQEKEQPNPNPAIPSVPPSVPDPLLPPISSVEWNRSKIMIVGAGRAGKTAFTRSLLGEDFTAQLESTIGINEFTCDVKSVGLSSEGEDWGKYVEKARLLEAEVAKRMKAKPRDSNQVKAKPVSPSKPNLPAAVESSHTGSVKSVRNTKAASLEDNDLTSSQLPDEFNFSEDLSKAVDVKDVDQEAVKCLAEDVTLFQSKYIVSIYDFGGQPVFNAIHPFFLTKYGLYVVAFNMSQLLPQSEEKEECLDFIRYWLNSIAVHSMNAATEIMAPIFLVGSRKDIVSDPKDHEAISDLLYATFHKSPTWPFVIRNGYGVGSRGNTGFCFFPVDNTKSKSRSDRTMKELMKSIEHEISKSAYVSQELPAIWLKTIDDLKDLKRSYVEYGEVSLLALKNGISEGSLPSFLSFLHEMGIAMWHQDQKLRNVIILDPVRYFVDAATIIICKHRPSESTDRTWHETPIHRNCHQKYRKDWQLFLESGILTESALQCLLSSVAHREIIIQLMIKYGLLLQLSMKSLEGSGEDAAKLFLSNYGIENARKSYLVPSLLPDALKTANHKLNAPCSHCCYFGCYLIAPHKSFLKSELKTIGFLPNGLFDRLLCRLIALCMGELYLDELTYSISRSQVLLSYSGQSFELLYESRYNLLKLIVHASNPIPIYLLVLDVMNEIVSESFPSMRCMTLLKYDSESSAIESPDPCLIRLTAIEESVAKGTGLAVGSVSIDQSQLKSLYNVWLYRFKQTLALSRYDGFISYRWNDQDSPLVSALFDNLTRGNLSQHNYAPAAVFMDRNRLETGKDFRADFVSALLHSKIIIPIVSVESLKRMMTHDGSAVDNLLLEWILSLHMSHHGTKIIPIIFGSHVKDKDTKMIQNILPVYVAHDSVNVLEKLSKAIPTATFQAAERFLGSSLSAEMKSWSVEKIIQELLASNTPFYENEEKLKRFQYPISLSALAKDYSQALLDEMSRSWKSIIVNQANDDDIFFHYIVNHCRNANFIVETSESARRSSSHLPVSEARSLKAELPEPDREKAWNLLQKVLSTEKDSAWKERLEQVMEEIGVMGEFDIFSVLSRDQWLTISLALRPGPQTLFLKALNLSAK